MILNIMDVLLSFTKPPFVMLFSSAKFLCLGHKTNNLRIGKKRGPKTATRQNIGAASAAPAAPLPTPMSSCQQKYTRLLETNWPFTNDMVRVICSNYVPSRNKHLLIMNQQKIDL